MMLIGGAGRPWHRGSRPLAGQSPRSHWPPLSARTWWSWYGGHGGGVAACVAATAMTLPAAFARRAPLAASAALAAAAAANELFCGHLVRCGATLPVVSSSPTWPAAPALAALARWLSPACSSRS